jgi:hypothetical protein
LAEAADLTVTRVVPLTAVFHDANEADKILGLHRVTERAVSADYLSAADAEQWLAYLASAPFFASATVFVVVAERP